MRRTRSWHAATGLWLAVGLLLLSATGLTWSRYAGANFSLGLDALSAHKPALSTSLAGGEPAGGGHHSEGGGDAPAGEVDSAAVDGVLAAARAAGMTGPLEIGVAEDATSAWTVTEVDDTWPVHKDRIAVDAATHTVTARSGFADWPVLAQLSSLGIQAHMAYSSGWSISCCWRRWR